jgi:histidyl-tRNA synthetase
MDGVDYVVCALNPEMYGTAASISWKLRMLGKTVDLMPTPKKKVAASFNYADQTGAKRMVFVAPDEIAKGVVRIKDLRTKDSSGESIQVDCPLEALETADGLVAQALAGAS